MIFGNDSPKMQISAVDVLLDHAVIEVDRVDEKTIVHESDLNRARTVITKPQHHIFQVSVHLHEYPDPKAKYDEIVAHLGSKIVKLWRHSDGLAFRKNGTSNDADFHFISYQEYYITQNDYADGLRLFLRSIDLIDHSSHGDNFTFARALTSTKSNAWYLDPTTGLLTVAPDNTTSRRLVAGRYKGTAIVIEEAATNLITHPSDLSDTSWQKSTMGIATDTLETLDPKGTNTADKMTASSANGFVAWNSAVGVGNDAAARVWLKSQVGNVGGNLFIRGDISGFGQQAITVIPIWKPFRIFADTSGFSGTIEFEVGITDNGQVFYFWAGGLYDNFQFAPTIPDPIATAATTRALEKFTILSANTNLNKLKGTVSMWVKPYFDPTVSDQGAWFIEGGDSAGATADLHLRLFFNGPVGNRLTLQVHRDNGNLSGINYTPAVNTGMIQDTWAHLVLTWDSTISDGGHIYVNGTELLTGSTNAAFNVSETGDTIAIGSQLDAVSGSYGEMDELFIDDEVWTAAKVLEVFNMPNGLPRTLI